MSLVGRIVAGEASTPAGQQAVLNVMQNRAAINFGGYGTTIEAQATAPLQFSAYPNALGQASGNTEAMVSAANAGTLGNIVPNSLNYANPSIMNQASTPNSWVWGAQASGQGVTIGGNTFWANSRGGSPGYDPSQLYNGTGSGTTASDGVPDNASGGTPSYVDPNADPLGSSLTMTPGSSPGASGTSASTSTSTAGDVGQGAPVTQGLQQGTIAAIQGWITNIENSFGSGLKSALTAGENAVGTYFAGLQNWFSRAFLIILGIVIVAVALIALMWDHGGKETVVQMGRIAAA